MVLKSLILNNIKGFIVKYFFNKLIYKGNKHNSIDIVYKTCLYIQLKTNKNPILILEKTIYNIIIPLKSNQHKNIKSGITLDKAIKNSINIIIQSIKSDYKSPIYIRLGNLIIRIYNKQDTIFFNRIKELKKILA